MVKILAEILDLSRRPHIHSFREYQDDERKKYKKAVISDVITVPVCTAECERGSRQMNAILSPTRWRQLLQFQFAQQNVNEVPAK